MKRTLLKSKLHRAWVTRTDLNYEGSITIDKYLLKKADIIPYEKVDIYNINNGHRFATYVIEGSNGEIELNGAAARMAQVGDEIIIVSYGQYSEAERKSHKVRKLLLDHNNNITDLWLNKIK